MATKRSIFYDSRLGQPYSRCTEIRPGGDSRCVDYATHAEEGTQHTDVKGFVWPVELQPVDTLPHETVLLPFEGTELGEALAEREDQLRELLSYCRAEAESRDTARGWPYAEIAKKLAEILDGEG